MSNTIIPAGYRSALNVHDTQIAIGQIKNAFNRWSKDSDIGGKTLDISAEMANVEQWIRRRMVYLDNNVFVRTAPLLGDVDDNGVVDIADVTSLIDYTLNGSPVNELNSDVDNDGEITIADIVLLIDIVLSK